MSNIKPINNNSNLRVIRDAAWKKNAEDWANTRVLPKKLTETLINVITEKSNLSDSQVIDLGCGNAWVLDHLMNVIDSEIKYIGIDINQYFINSNKEKFKNKINTVFINQDLESNFFSIDKISDNSKIFVSCLSMIEMVDLKQVFKNISKIMNYNDKLIIVILDSNFEIFRLSENVNELENNLVRFLTSSKCYYEKNIINDSKKIFNKKYIGILHKIEDYYNYANSNEIRLVSEKIINCYNQNSKKGTIYRIITFLK